eukprot:7099459-Prymnesium_polylepis.1
MSTDDVTAEASEEAARDLLPSPELRRSAVIEPDLRSASPAGARGPMQLTAGVPPAPILYRSGDVAVIEPDGNLRFCGRLDRQ